MNECYIKAGEELIEAELIGVYQHSRIVEPSPMLGGHAGGVIAFPVAVVRVGSELKQIDTSDVIMVEG